MELLKTYYKTKIICTLTFVLSIQTNCFSQTRNRPDILFTRGFNMGYFGMSPFSRQDIAGNGFKPSAGFIAAQNGRGGLSLSGTTSLGFNLGLMRQNKHNKNWWGINFDIQQNRNTQVFDLPFQKKIPQRSGDGDADDPLTGDSTLVSTGTWVETNKYLKLTASIQHMWSLNNFSKISNAERYGFWKLSIGQPFLYRNNGSIAKEGLTEVGADDHGNQIKTRSGPLVQPRYMISSEIGIYTLTDDRSRSISFGLAWHMPINGGFSKEYEFFTKTPGKLPNQVSYPSTGKQNVNFQGGSVLLNMTYTFNSKMKRRPIDEEKIKEIIEKPVEPIVIHNRKPHSLNGRHVKIKETIALSDTTVTIFVWDKGKIDGDRIELYLNGTQILQDYTVGKEKKEIVLNLNPGKNYLVMHAINLGRIPPNTAAIKIKDNGKDKTIVLSSDTKESGAIELICPE